MSANRIAGVGLLVMGMAVVCQAAPVPEIDPGSATSAVTLLAGVLLLIRGRRKSR